ncbi:hypothetical protein [Pseudoclavibacter sp. AY1H1]|uniref:hypothetical protein n=1 Tax=Pseudoclavibacter sp. AY1H1 TaxID=2080584 RepID=UPI000CE80644|nr:hypothetical protein [Pseudoclavibacter sp. AY1H1]PPF32674.1 hypothetical protein C5E05_19410 [Pseudoclavibacter sp. AY1H1]
MDDALGFYGVLVGAGVTLIGTVLVPWLRDHLDRRRRQQDQERLERRDWLMTALAELLNMRQAKATRDGSVGAAQARYGAAFNQLTIRLTPDEQPVLDILNAMLAIVQEPTAQTPSIVGNAMLVLTLWERGDIKTSQVLNEVESRAHLKFDYTRGPEPIVSYIPPGT